MVATDEPFLRCFKPQVMVPGEASKSRDMWTNDVIVLEVIIVIYSFLSIIESINTFIDKISHNNETPMSKNK